VVARSPDPLAPFDAFTGNRAGGPVVHRRQRGFVTGANAQQMFVYLQDPYAAPGTAPVAVDELRISELWAGDAVLLRANRSHVASDAPFNLYWLIQLVLGERKSLRDIGLASFTMSILTIFPAILVMTTVNKVLQFNSVSTLMVVAAIMAVCVVYETLLGYARRLIISVIGARLDAKLSLHVFNRLVRLPLDYFERHPAGQTMYQIGQVYRVREFLTGKLLATFLGLTTLCVLLSERDTRVDGGGLRSRDHADHPRLFEAAPGPVIAVTNAETWKAATTIIVPYTIARSIGVARVCGQFASRPNARRHFPASATRSSPERFALRLCTYMAIKQPSGYTVGGLFAFMMLSGRVAQPLVGLARLVEDYEEVGAAIGEAGSVLNRPLELDAPSGGLRPKFLGGITFQDVTFTYLGTKVPALDRVSFSVPAGTILGIVGRSGSGKSTIARLLQGINRDYSGFVKIDSADLREINLRHLRQSFGVVLQDNFLFRGSIRDNIIAGRPGLTLADAMHAARLAGAEEFIERMPNGYETYIEEGSPNLSGGQKQRLAIARAHP
jgi:ATP-binding cassette, subfamily B, bacterial HlyB/CyaB